MTSLPASAPEHLAILRSIGRGRVRRRLEALVNAGTIPVASAQKTYAEAFGDALIAVKDQREVSSSTRMLLACFLLAFASALLTTVLCSEVPLPF